MFAMETVRWLDAQQNELAVWQRTVREVPEVLAEMAEAAALVRFGKKHGLATYSEVAELGIGPMGIGWAAFAQCTTALGVDPLPMLRIATGDENIDRFAAELQGRIDFLQADATEKLPLEEGTFDLIVCDNVVDHAQDPVGILAEARRIVRAEGRLLFGVNVFSVVGLLKWRQLTRRLHPAEPNVVCHPHSFLERDLGKLLATAGWEKIASDSHSNRMHRLAAPAYRVRVIARPI